MGSTEGLADDYVPSCAPGTQDAAHLFVAPSDGFYVFETAGSAFDTVLTMLLGNDCDASEIACDDDAVLGDPTSHVSAYLLGGASTIVVVDGFSAGQQGAYVLSIDAFVQPCGAEDLGNTAPVSLASSTTFDSDKLTSTCAPVPGLDRVVLWQAPADGVYEIDTLGSSFDTILYVRQGVCGAVELACNDDSDGTLQSVLEVDLLAGDVITIVVDGYGLDESGAFSLAIGAV